MALIVSSAIAQAEPSRPAPPAQARLCAQATNQRGRKVTGHLGEADIPRYWIHSAPDGHTDEPGPEAWSTRPRATPTSS